MTKKKKPSSKYTHTVAGLQDLIDEIAEAKTLQEMYVVAARVAQKFVDIVRIDAEIEIEKAYGEAAAEVHGIPTFAFGAEDRAAMDVIKNSKVLWQSYQGIAQELSDKINENIYEYYRNKKNLRDFVHDIKEEMNLAEDEIVQIFRTETSHVSNLARERSFKRIDQRGDKRYRWRVIHDHRTSPECKEIEGIVNKRGGSVPLQELKNIVRLVTIKYRGNNWIIRDWNPHPNCRSQPSVVL